MKQHKWHKEIKAWADGAKIESRAFDVRINEWSSWSYEEKPQWYDNAIFEYQIKPQHKEPQYLYVSIVSNSSIEFELKKEYIRGKYLGKIKLEVEDDK